MPSPFKFRRTDAPTLNGAQSAHKRWHQETRLRAIAAISFSGGFISGRELAHSLNMSPKGLRQFLLNSEDDTIMVEIRADSCGRGEPWYRLNPSCVQQAAPPPLLVDYKPTTKRFRLLHPKPGNCGPHDPGSAPALLG